MTQHPRLRAVVGPPTGLGGRLPLLRWRRRLSPLLLSLLSAAGVAACRPAARTPAAGGGTALYALDSVNGRPLPWALDVSPPGRRVEVVAGTLTLDSAGQYTARAVRRESRAGASGSTAAVRTDTSEARGRFRSDGRGGVVLGAPDGGPAEEAMTSADGGQTLRGGGVPVTGGIAILRTYVYRRVDATPAGR